MDRVAERRFVYFANLLRKPTERLLNKLNSDHTLIPFRTLVKENRKNRDEFCPKNKNLSKSLKTVGEHVYDILRPCYIHISKAVCLSRYTFRQTLTVTLR